MAGVRVGVNWFLGLRQRHDEVTRGRFSYRRTSFTSSPSRRAQTYTDGGRVERKTKRKRTNKEKTATKKGQNCVGSETEGHPVLERGVPGGGTVVARQRGVERRQRRRFAPAGAVDVRQVAAPQQHVVVEVAERFREERVHFKVFDGEERVGIEQRQLGAVAARERARPQLLGDVQAAVQLEGRGQTRRSHAHPLVRLGSKQNTIEPRQHLIRACGSHLTWYTCSRYLVKKRRNGWSLSKTICHVTESVSSTT